MAEGSPSTRSPRPLVAFAPPPLQIKSERPSSSPSSRSDGLLDVVRRATAQAATLAGTVGETLSEKGSSLGGRRSSNKRAPPRTPTLKLSALNKWGTRRVLSVKETEKFLGIQYNIERLKCWTSHALRSAHESSPSLLCESSPSH